AWPPFSPLLFLRLSWQRSFWPPSFWLLSFSQRLLSQFFCPFPKPLVFRLPWKPPLLFPVLQSQIGKSFLFFSNAEQHAGVHPHRVGDADFKQKGGHFR